MRKIYIDVSNLLKVNFVTGIQRVVRNVVMEFLVRIPEQLVLLCYQNGRKRFIVLSNDRFKQHYSEKEQLSEIKTLFTKEEILPSDIQAGDLFFDIDSVWNNEYKRSALLPELKRNGVRCAVYIYDIIPILYPQFCHVNTLHNFMDYLGAYLQYGDMIITSTKCVLDEVNKLADQIGVERIQGGFSWLGSNFCAEADISGVDARVIKAVESGKYIVCVGTIEPRKNLGFVLDCFEHGLFQKGYHLIFAGRIGWNVEDLKKRIENCKYNGSHFYHFEGLNDASVDYLYRHAAALAFATYDEGFGLPIIEAYERKTPVISSDRPVLREVGGDLADYFTLNSEKEFCALAEKYFEDEQYRNARIDHLSTYERYTWSQTAEKILSLLSATEAKEISVSGNIRQMVILTARVDAVCATLKYVDALMPFIQEIILCCPDRMEKQMLAGYSGRLKIITVTDSTLLAGRELPEDHQARNTFLRACAMRTDLIDDVFIMSDDDYRPLHEIHPEMFLSDGKYNAYYCYDIDCWKGTANSMTSYDYGMQKTAAFLKDHCYPLKQYSSHMPQVIDRHIYLELLKKHPGIESIGLDEWSIYFNYFQATYPSNLRALPYRTMCWPGAGTDWEIQYEPESYSFENYYENLYDKGGIFEGFSREYGENSVREGEKKKILFRRYMDIFRSSRIAFKCYQRQYEAEYSELPAFGIEIKLDNLQVYFPKYLSVSAGGFVRVPFFVKIDGNVKSDIELDYAILSASGEVLWGYRHTVMPAACKSFELPVWGISQTGATIFSLRVYVGKLTKEVLCPLYLVDTADIMREI